jgi:hypothetical protein
MHSISIQKSSQHSFISNTKSLKLNAYISSIITISSIPALTHAIEIVAAAVFLNCRIGIRLMQGQNPLLKRQQCQHLRISIGRVSKYLFAANY